MSAIAGTMAFTPLGAGFGLPEPHVTDPDDPRTLWRITVKPPDGLPA